MKSSKAWPILAGIGVALGAAGCTEDDRDSDDDTGLFGDGDGDGDGGGDGDGDGDGGGDGDGDGDGGGDGDGDGDGSGDGDGDGDGAGDGDGDGDGDGACDGTSPYQGGWEIGCCQDEITPTVYQPGQIGPGSILPDWTLTDSYGDSVRFYDFCHDAIYYELSALW